MRNFPKFDISRIGSYKTMLGTYKTMLGKNNLLKIMDNQMICIGYLKHL